MLFFNRIEHSRMPYRLQKRTETKRTRASEDDRSSRSSSSTTNTPEENELSHCKSESDGTTIGNADVLCRLQKDHSEEGSTRKDIFSENSNSIQRLHSGKDHAVDNIGASNILNKNYQNRMMRLHGFDRSRDSVDKQNGQDKPREGEPYGIGRKKICFEGRQQCENSMNNCLKNLNALEADNDEEECRNSDSENDVKAGNQPKSNYHKSNDENNEFSTDTDIKVDYREEMQSNIEKRDEQDKERLKQLMGMQNNDNVRDALMAHKIASEDSKNSYNVVEATLDNQRNENSSETSRSSSVSREISESNSEESDRAQTKYHHIQEGNFNRMNIADENSIGMVSSSVGKNGIISDRRNDSSIMNQNGIISEKESHAPNSRRHHESLYDTRKQKHDSRDMFADKDLYSDDNTYERKDDNTDENYLRKVEDTSDNSHSMNLRKSEDRRNITIKRLSQQRKSQTSEISLRSRRNHKRLTEPSVESGVEGDSPDSGQQPVTVTRNKIKGVKTNGRLTRSQRRGHKRAAPPAVAVDGAADDDSGIQGDIYEFNEKESNLEDIEPSSIRRSRHDERQSTSPEPRLQLPRNSEEFSQLQPPALVPEEPWPRSTNSEVSEKWERKISQKHSVNPGGSNGR